MPVVRGLYKSVKQIFETVLSQSRAPRSARSGWSSIPRKDCGRSSSSRPRPQGEIAEQLPGTGRARRRLPALHAEPDDRLPLLSAAPRFIELDITVEDGAKLIMSAGLIQPEGQELAAKRGAPNSA